MSKEDEVYVCVTEYDGAFVGTPEDIIEWCHGKSVGITECRYYELGEEVTLKISFVK